MPLNETPLDATPPEKTSADANGSRLRRPGRYRPWLLAVLIVAVAAGAATWYWLPEVVRRVAVARIEALTGRPVSLARVDLALWFGRITLHEFRLYERPGIHGAAASATAASVAATGPREVAGTPRGGAGDAPPTAEFERLDVRIRLPWLLLGRVRIADIALTNSTVRVVRLPGGDFNISDLFRGESSTSEPLDLHVGRLAVRGGRVLLEDRALPEPRTWASEQLEIDAQDLSTRAGGGTASARSVTAGARVGMDLRQIRLYPIHLEGTVTTDGLDLSLAGIYVPPSSGFAIPQGRLTSTVTVALDARDGLRADVTSRVQDAVLTQARDGEVLAAVPELTSRVRDFAFRADALRVGELSVEGTMNVRDPTAGPKAPLKSSRVRARLDDVTWPATTAGRLDLESSIPGGGALAVAGTLRPPPEATQLRARVTDLNLAPWAHLLPIRARVTGFGQADLRIDEPLAAGVPARIQGSVAVTRVAVADERRQHVTAQRIEASGLTLDWPRQLAVERVVLTGPRAIVERDPSGRVSVADLAEPRRGGAPAPDARTPAGAAGRRTPDAPVGMRIPGVTAVSPDARPTPDARAADRSPAGARPAAPAARGPALTVAVGEIAVRGGAVAWRDATVAPAAALDASGVNATIKGAGWPLTGPLDVRADLRPPGGGALRASGRVTLDPLGADLRVAARGAELGPYQPYLATPGRLGGAADLDVAVSVPSLAEQRATVRGTAGLARIDVRDRERSVLRLERAQATGIDVAWPERIDVARVALTGPWVLAERDEKGAFTIRPLLTPRAPPAAARDAKSTEAAGAPSDAPAAPPARADAKPGNGGGPTDPARGNGAHGDAKPSDMAPADAARGAAAPADVARGGAAPAEGSPTEGSSSPEAGQAPPPVAISVAHLTVEHGGMRIVDRAVDPPFAVDLRSTAMRLDGFSTARAKPARLELTGQLGESSELSLGGSVRGLGDRPLLVDLSGELRRFSAPRANPYVVEHAGWRIRQGSVSSKVRVRVEGDALSARTDLRVSQLALARAAVRDEAKARIGLPLGMLTSLMKNSRGDIEVSIPVGGRLDDPRFDFSEAIWHAVRTVAVNAIAAPVSWIGRVRYTRDARIDRVEIDPVPFPSGGDALTDEAREQLSRLAAFMGERLEVRMALTPVVSARDVAALRRPAVEAAIERAAKDGGLSREAAAARLFERRFPGRPLPDTSEAVIAALLEREDGNDGDVEDLGKRRVSALRTALKRAGVDSARLPERPVARRGDADGQVALEIMEADVARSSGVRGLLERLGVPLKGAGEAR